MGFRVDRKDRGCKERAERATGSRARMAGGRVKNKKQRC